MNIDPWSLSWSARGLLAWEKSRRTGVERSRRTGVFVSDSRGGGRRRILSAPGPSRLPRWSYDGSKLSYVCRDVLCGTRPDGSARRVLSPRCDMTEDLAGMAWSPDGRQIACVGRLGNLMTLRLDTGHRQILRRPTSRGVGYLPVEITWRPRPTR